MINFAAFLLGACIIGGFASHGGLQNGSYFVKWHKSRTSRHVVSQAVYDYSHIHEISMFATHALGLATAGICWTMARRIDRQDAA